MANSRDSISDIWGERTPHMNKEWPTRVDERTLEKPDKWVQSCCILCSNGCALDIGVKEGKMVGVRGRKADRVNHGRLGPKGLHGWVANHSPSRLTRPLIRRDGKLRETTWDTAMKLIVSRTGAFGVLRDLHALFVMASEIHIALTIVMQASKELRDEELLSLCIRSGEQNKRQQAWLVTQIEHRASHTLVVPQ